MLETGTRIGRYTVVEAVGTGATSEVYRAEDTLLARPVALKVLHGGSDRDRQEAAAVATLHHPNIVPTFDVVEHGGRLCLVQEWADGGSLEAALAGKPLDAAGTVRVGVDVARALAHAHAQGILHRDLKPSNVLLSGGVHKLVDFGALGRLEAGTGTTRSGEIAGTPLWMSPEQALGERQTPASDLFGLGLVLFRCLHGHVPGGTAGNLLQLLQARVAGAIEVPESPLRPLLSRCLARDPALRPQSAEDVLRELQRVARELEGPVAAGSAEAHESVPPPPPPPSLPLRRFRLRPVPAAAALAALAAVGAALMTYAPPAGGPSVAPRPPVSPLALAAGTVMAGAALGSARHIRRRSPAGATEAERRAAQALFGAQQRDQLTASLVVEIDSVVSRLNSFDARFLGITVIAMLREYEEGKQSSDRQAALLNVVTLMEKLQLRFSPWHVRHKDAVASVVAVVGCLAGLMTAVAGLLR